jgi:hypothetical protein
MKKYLIYGLTDPRTGAVRYVGKSCRGLKRARSHRYIAQDKTHKGSWIRSLLAMNIKYGIVVLEQATCEQTLNDKERKWIAHGREQGWRLTNLTEGGEGTSGLRHRLDSIEKMRAANLGKKMSDAHRAKLIAFHTGRKHTPETIKKMSERQRGRIGHIPSEETRAKMSAAHIGKPGTMTGKKHTEQARARMSASRFGKPGTMRGRKHTTEARAKMSAARTGRKFSVEHRERIGAAQRGRRLSEERKAELRATRRPRVATSRECTEEISENTPEKHSLTNAIRDKMLTGEHSAMPKKKTSTKTSAPSKRTQTVKHDIPFMVRLTPAERRMYEDAATETGLQISAWMRTVCTTAARAMGLR